MRDVLLYGAAVAVAIWGVAHPDDAVAALVYRASAGLLAAIAVSTALTGARTPVGWFKACPAVLGAAVALLLLGSVL